MARNRRETQGSSGPTRGAIGDYMIGALGYQLPDQSGIAEDREEALSQ